MDAVSKPEWHCYSTSFRLGLAFLDFRPAVWFLIEEMCKIRKTKHGVGEREIDALFAVVLWADIDL